MLKWIDCGFSSYVYMCLACSVCILISIICHSISYEFCFGVQNGQTGLNTDLQLFPSFFFITEPI